MVIAKMYTPKPRVRRKRKVVATPPPPPPPRPKAVRKKRTAQRAPDPPPAVKKRRSKKQKVLLEKFRKYPVVYAACSQAGIDKATYYRWRNADLQFAAEADEALNEGTLFMNDMVESILLKKAKEENMTAVIFWLKNNSSNYGERSEHIHRHRHRFEKSEEDGLTEERMEEIVRALRAWEGDDEDGE